MNLHDTVAQLYIDIDKRCVSTPGVNSDAETSASDQIILTVLCLNLCLYRMTEGAYSKLKISVNY